MLSFNEKRKHPRVNIRIPLNYKELRSATPTAKGALTKNISEGGVRFSTEKFISLSCRLIVEISLPSVPKPLRAISKVAWIKKIPASDNYEIGNQFLDMTKEDMHLMSDFIKQIFDLPPAKPDQI